MRPLCGVLQMNRRTFLEAGGAAAMLHGLAGRSVAAPVHIATPNQEKTRRGGATILTNATLIDGIQPEPQRRRTVILEEGRIVRVDQNPPVATERRDGRVIDLEGLWLLPGLCDAHSHLINPLHAPGETRIDSYIRMGGAAIDALQVGVTSLRVLGAPDFSDVAWRNAFARGLFQGPRIVAGGHTVVPTAGHGASYDYGQIVVADGPVAVRRAVREQIHNDVDQIKLTISGGVFGHRWDDPDYTHYTQEEMEAALNTAGRRGYKVAVHAGNPEAVKRSVRAGAHTIEHGYNLDDECIQLMRRKRTVFVPTLCVTSLTPNAARSQYEKQFVRRWPMPDHLFERADNRRPAHLAAFRAALEGGVRIASGPDHSPPAETAFLEIEVLVRAGMTPMQAIIAATRVAAEASGLESQIGTVTPGKLGDLLVVAGDPLESISNLRRTAMVIKQGEIVLDRRRELQPARIVNRPDVGAAVHGGKS